MGMGYRGSLWVTVSLLSSGARAQDFDHEDHGERAAQENEYKLDAQYDGSERKKSHKISQHAAEFCQSSVLSNISALLYSVRTSPIRDWPETRKQAFVTDHLLGVVPFKDGRFVNYKAQTIGNVRYVLYTMIEGGRTRLIKVKLHDDPQNGVYKSERQQKGPNDLVQVEELNEASGGRDILCAENTYQLKSIGTRLKQLRAEAGSYTSMQEQGAALAKHIQKHPEKYSPEAINKAVDEASSSDNVTPNEAHGGTAPTTAPAGEPYRGPPRLPQANFADDMKHQQDMRARYCPPALVQSARDVIEAVKLNRAFSNKSLNDAQRKKILEATLSEVLDSPDLNPNSKYIPMSYNNRLAAGTGQNLGDSMKNIGVKHKVGLYRSGVNWIQVGNSYGFEVRMDYKDRDGKNDAKQQERIRYLLSPEGRLEPEVSYKATGNGAERNFLPCLQIPSSKK